MFKDLDLHCSLNHEYHLMLSVRYYNSLVELRQQTMNRNEALRARLLEIEKDKARDAEMERERQRMRRMHH